MSWITECLEQQMVRWSLKIESADQGRERAVRLKSAARCGERARKTRLSMVKWTGKLAVLVMVISVWASPLMACMTPDALLTDEERECCKSVADDCGHMDMPASHSCCEVVTRQVGSYLISSRFPSIQPAPAVALFVVVVVNPATANAMVASSPVHGQSPPVSPPDTISVLRI